MNILNKKIFVFCAIFSFLKPAGFDFLGYHELNATINIARILFAVIIFALYFGRLRKFSSLIQSEIVLFLSFFISTIYNEDSDVTNLSIFAISILSFTCMVEIYANRNIVLFINMLFLTYFVLIGCNLFYMISVLGFQKGSDELFMELGNSKIVYNILSSDNLVATYTFPALCSGFMYSYLKDDKYNVWSWILYIMVFATIIILWSATSLVGVLLVVGYIAFVYENKRFQNIVLSPNTLFILAISVVIGFTFLGVQNLFSFIIVDLLQKDLSLTGRTNIWEIGLRGFNQEPLFGKGFNSMTIDNGLIQILFVGGLLSLLFFLNMFLVATVKIRLNKGFELDKFISFLLTVVLIMTISESWFFFFGFFVILSIAYNVRNIQSNLYINQVKTIKKYGVSK
jgi:O-antigen ligase